MGGKEASRGFIYQGFASILEALTQKGWDEIYVEFPTSNDKVDIALKDQGNIIKSIQVKSTINSFSKLSVENWIKDLVEDVSSLEYQICLIGNAESNAVTFLNSIEKYQNGKEDGISKDSLENFDKIILDKGKITYNILPFNKNTLLDIVRAKMHKYISAKQYKITYEQVDLISYAVLSTKMLLSTNGSCISKEGFDQKIFDWFKLMGGSALQKATPLSEHILQCFNLETKTLSDTSTQLYLIEYPPFKEYLSQILVECRKYIQKISNIDLPAYSGDVSKNVKLDVYKLQQVQQLSIADLERIIETIETPHRAEMEDEEKEEIVSKAKLLLNIDIHPEFFYIGNLISTYNKFKRTFEPYGEDIEKEKYILLSELSSAFEKYDLAQFFGETFSDYILILLALKNISTVMDNNITIKVFIDNSSAKVFNPDEYQYSSGRVDLIYSEKLINIFFALPSDNTISKEDEWNPPDTPTYRNKYTSLDFYTSLARRIATATFTKDSQSVYEFQIKSLRPNETKWFNTIILLKPLRSELNLSYQMLSNQSDGTLSGEIKILIRY